MQWTFPDTLLYGADYNPEQWSEAIWLEDLRLMKLAHVNMVSINIFSWALLEPEPDQYRFDQLDRIMDLLLKHDIAADLATATASPPTWMSRLYPSLLPVTREGVRMSHGSRQAYCPNSLDYQQRAGALVQRLAERYATHPALRIWHINNEYGCHTAQCYCDTCAQTFRGWLQQRYHTLEQLNVAWGTTFWSQHYTHWEDILPPRISPAQNNPGQTLDYWRFMSDSLLNCYRLEENILRTVTPHVPLTTNLMVAFKPVDAFAWAPHLDVVTFNMYPANSEPVARIAFPHVLMRSLKKGRPHLVMEQSPSQVNWMQQNSHKRPGRMRLHSLQALAHGADGVLFFQWRQSQAGAEKFHSAVVSHEGSEHNRIFQQAAQVGAELQKLSPEVVGSRMQAQVALVMDWQNWWAVEYQPGPSNQLHYWNTLCDYYQALHELNIAADIVTPESDLRSYKVVIAPLLYMLRSGIATKLEQFVAQGGELLVTFFSGIVDENDHVILGGYPGELRKLLGIYVEEFDPLTPEMSNQIRIQTEPLAGTFACDLWGELLHSEGAQVLGVFAHDYYAQQPALTRNTFGTGHAYYLATRPEHTLIRKLVQKLCDDAHVTPTLAHADGIEVTKRIKENGRDIYFLLNHTQHTQRVPLPPGTFTSLLDGKLIYESIEIDPIDVVVLRQEN